jgi:hypothetical protein
MNGRCSNYPLKNEYIEVIFHEQESIKKPRKKADFRYFLEISTFFSLSVSFSAIDYPGLEPHSSEYNSIL